MCVQCINSIFVPCIVKSCDTIIHAQEKKKSENAKHKRRIKLNPNGYHVKKLHSPPPPQKGGQVSQTKTLSIAIGLGVVVIPRVGQSLIHSFTCVKFFFLKIQIHCVLGEGQFGNTSVICVCNLWCGLVFCDTWHLFLSLHPRAQAGLQRVVNSNEM